MVKPSYGLSDDEVIRRACEVNENFRRLWHGEQDDDIVDGTATVELLRHLAYWTHRAMHAAPLFWRVAFPPEDWTPRHPDARTLAGPRSKYAR